MSDSYDSSDSHRSIGKNGHERAQDNEIKGIKRALDKWSQEFDRFREEDRKTHTRLADTLHSIESDWKWSRRIFGALWLIAVGLGGYVLSYAIQTEARIDALTEQVRIIQVQVTTADRERMRLEEEVRECRQRLNRR